MSTNMIENQLDLLIALIQNLPEMLCNELEKRLEIQRKIQIEEIKNRMACYGNNEEIVKPLE